MIIGIATLIMMLFGVGSADTFYVDKIDSSIKKYVTDKDRLKEMNSDLKAYNKSIRAFTKEENKAIKSLKERNLDRSTPISWYEDFFDERMASRKTLQDLFMTERLHLQEKINEEEWNQIMATASSEQNKAQKKEAKEKEKSKIESVINTVSHEIKDEKKAREIEQLLRDISNSFESLMDAYNDQNVDESGVLTDKNATKSQFEEISQPLNQKRYVVYQNYILLMKSIKENSNDEQWEQIIKVLNKLLD